MANAETEARRAQMGFWRRQLDKAAEFNSKLDLVTIVAAVFVSAPAVGYALVGMIGGKEVRETYIQQRYKDNQRPQVVFNAKSLQAAA